jgi:hypothetical protein
MSEAHHKIAKSRGGPDDLWNLEELSEYDHAYNHAVDFVLFPTAPAFDFRLAGWDLLPGDLRQAVRAEKSRRTTEHNKTIFMREVTSRRSKGLLNPIHRDDVKSKVYTEERNAKISEALKGREKTEEHKANLSGSNNGMFGKTGEQNPFYGKKHNEEALSKMSAAKKGKPWSDARREAYERNKKK